MTTTGLMRQLYSDYVEPRPYSRFTSEDNEQQANDDWALRAIDWAKRYMNEAGGLNQAGVDRYILHLGGGKPSRPAKESL